MKKRFQKVYIRTCEICSAVFVVVSSSALVCSPECREKRHKFTVLSSDYIPVSEINTDLNKPISEFIKECEAFE